MPLPVSGATSVPVQDPGATSQVNRPDQMGKDTFLKLLVAQLKYQDPSKPADSSQFIAQTAQFSQVEALDKLTTQNASLLAAQQMMSAGQMVGKTVMYTDENGSSHTGVVSSVVLDPSNPVAMIGGVAIPVGRVTAITQPPASTPAA